MSTGYIPPEVMNGEPASRASDMWSVGRIIAELCTAWKVSHPTQPLPSQLTSLPARLMDKAVSKRLSATAALGEEMFTAQPSLPTQRSNAVTSLAEHRLDVLRTAFGVSRNAFVDSEPPRFDLTVQRTRAPSSSSSSSTTSIAAEVLMDGAVPVVSSLRRLAECKDLRQPLNIRFSGEGGHDAGGLSVSFVRGLFESALSGVGGLFPAPSEGSHVMPEVRTCL